MTKIAIVGGGIIGLSSALCIRREICCSGSDVEITLITSNVSPFTTGDGAAGVWSPYLLGATPEKDVYKWAKATHDFLHELWKTEDGGVKGVSMLPVMRVTSQEEPDPLWKDIVFGFRRMKPAELQVLNKPSLKTGFAFVSFTCEAPRLLPYFLDAFKAAGGKVLMKTVDDIRALANEFTIVVNCTGLDARRVVPDPLVVPKRGQVIRVIAPSVKWAILDDDDDGNYVIPNQEAVVLGGTHQEGDFNTSVYPEDSEFIKKGCFKIIPSLQHAQIHNEWVGLRPGRPSVRLEMETHGISSGRTFIIHNYGHGGSGLTLFWGCALQTAGLVKDALLQVHGPFRQSPKSKL